MELLVALAIVVLVIGASFEFFRSYLRSEHRATEKLNAIRLAQNIEARIGLDLPLEEMKGQPTNSSMKWSYTVSPRASSIEQEQVLFDVQIRIFSDGRANELYRLDTVKIR